MKYTPKRTFLCSIICTALILFSCNSDDDANEMAECEEVFCTLELVTIVVSIQDINQNPVALDSYEVINLATGESLPTAFTDGDFETAQQTGIYPIAGDGSFAQNQEAELQLRGFINDEQVITSDYVVATDCCHISLVSGNVELILE